MLPRGKAEKAYAVGIQCKCGRPYNNTPPLYYIIILINCQYAGRYVETFKKICYNIKKRLFCGSRICDRTLTIFKKNVIIYIENRK